jgi:hypothetical protein
MIVRFHDWLRLMRPPSLYWKFNPRTKKLERADHLAFWHWGMS